jgi:glyoxylase-like metal-dependent hydrolase (beta-lactamase superfamily II)
MREQPGIKQFGRIVRLPTPTGYDFGDINSYAILPEPGSNQLVLIDTGVGREVCWQALETGLGQFDFAIEDITLLLLTHGHTDHFGQAARIKEVSGCEVWGHGAISASVNRYLPSPEQIAREKLFFHRLGLSDAMYDKAYKYRKHMDKVYKPCALDRELSDGDVIPVEGFELQTIHTPGHCPEEVVFWQAETRQMFSGDHLLTNITPVCLLHVPELPGADRIHALTEYYQSTDKVIPYDVKYVYPSHGDVIYDHRELIAGYKLSTERRLLKISRILEKHGSLSPLGVAQQLFPKVWESQLYAVISEVMGHLDMLADGGYADITERGGILHYASLSVPEPGAVFEAVSLIH